MISTNFNCFFYFYLFIDTGNSFRPNGLIFNEAQNTKIIYKEYVKIYNINYIIKASHNI